jgi:hypothetical protein
MGFSVDLDGDAISVRLSGWDLAMNGFRRRIFPRPSIVAAYVDARTSLEPKIDHRVIGTGSHSGAGRPNRRRVGTMLGRDVVGMQFWAVAAGRGSQDLLVLDLKDQGFVRAVLGVEQPEDFVRAFITPPQDT